MKRWLPMRGGLLAGLVLTAMGRGALGQKPTTALPVTQPTSSVAASAAATGSEQKPVSEKDTAPRTRVTWMSGMLTISAENSSINLILREISRQTGMKVTGGVRDERVFGSYGPGTPDAVLVALLTGTGSNMLLKEDKAGGPMELVLSVRAGGATPPSPTTGDTDEGEREETAAPPQRTFQGRPRQEPFRPPAGMAVPEPGYNNGQPSGGQSAPEAQGVSPAGSTPAATNQPGTDTAKTPQEIYDQLVKQQAEQTNQTPK